MRKSKVLTLKEIGDYIREHYVEDSVHWFMKYFRKKNQKYTQKEVKKILEDNPDIFIKKDLDFSELRLNDFNIMLWRNIFNTLHLMGFDFNADERAEFRNSIFAIKKRGVTNYTIEVWLTDVCEKSNSSQQILKILREARGEQNA